MKSVVVLLDANPFPVAVDATTAMTGENLLFASACRRNRFDWWRSCVSAQLSEQEESNSQHFYNCHCCHLHGDP